MCCIDEGGVHLIAKELQSGCYMTCNAGDIVTITSRSVHQDKDKVRATMKDILIGDVPDRGGRPLEGRAAAAQGVMPAWAPRTAEGDGNSLLISFTSQLLHILVLTYTSADIPVPSARI